MLYALEMLEPMEHELDLSDVLEVIEVMRCVLLCILEAVKGEFCSLEVMRCVLLGMRRLWRVGSIC